MEAALVAADNPISRAAIRQEFTHLLATSGNLARLREMRQRWSVEFARRCATMVANELRSQPVLKTGFQITPDASGGGQESFTPLGYQRGKRIDVAVSKPSVGLQIAVSLKGLNFRDGTGGNFDKNLTGRLYELRDEVSTIHEYMPRAFITSFFFVPVASCFDKPNAPSSFAHVVALLRSRTGRLDPTIAAHNWRADFGAVGVYGTGEPEEVQCGVPAGVVRYFPIFDAEGKPSLPPQRGLPVLSSTVSLRELIQQLLGAALHDTAANTRFCKVADESILIGPSEAATGARVSDSDEPMEEALDPIVATAPAESEAPDEGG